MGPRVSSTVTTGGDERVSGEMVANVPCPHVEHGEEAEAAAHPAEVAGGVVESGGRLT